MEPENRIEILYNGQTGVPFRYTWLGGLTVNIARPEWPGTYEDPEGDRWITFDVFTFMDSPTDWDEVRATIRRRHGEYTHPDGGPDNRYLCHVMRDPEDGGWGGINQ
ncbi:MAG: hypothetical protein GY906_10305 [bacterium]|nr:hypothetical protein [bacterium]